MNSRTIICKQKVTIGLYIHDVRDTSITSCWLRRYANDDGTEFIDEHQGVSLGDGAFSFTYPDGNYQLWKINIGGIDPLNAIYRLDFWHGAGDKTQWLGDNALPYVSSVADPINFLSTHLNIVQASNDNEPVNLEQLNERITELGDPYTAAEINALLLRYLDMRTGIGTQQVLSQVTFRDFCPYVMPVPTHLKHIVNKAYLESYVTARLLGITPSAYQQSLNIMRVLPSGVAEVNRVFRMLDLGIAAADSFSSATRRMMVVVEGGNADGAVLLNYNLLPPGGAPSYVDVVGVGEGVVIRVAEDTYSALNFGDTIYSNLIFDNEADSAGTDWEECIFFNCKFTNSFNPAIATHSFVNCLFISCWTDTVNTYTTTCKGDIRNSTTGAPELRILGKEAAGITAAATIALGSANYAVVSGNTQIDNITTTGWTQGSIITLYFTGTPTISVSGNISNVAGNISAVNGSVYSFIFEDTKWARIL